MSRGSASRALDSPRRRLEATRLPKGAVAALCAVVLALPAGLALAHSAKLDSQGRWVHHHTTAYAFCNNIDQDANLRSEATNARNQWDAASAVLTFPWRAECHEGPGIQANIQLQDGYLGNTGWRSSAINDANGQNLGYHATHTHVHFNLDSYWGAYGNYDRRALVCRELGQVIGVERVWASQYSAHGINNDCMSFAANPNDQVSKIENDTNFTYRDRPWDHSVDLVAQSYRDHVVDLSVSGPLLDGSSQPLTDDYYPLQIDASSPVGMARLEILINGQSKAVVAEPCSVDDEGCAEDYVFEFFTSSYPPGSYSVKVVATNTAGTVASTTFAVQTGVIAADDELPFDDTAAPVDGSGPGCVPFGLRPQEEGTVAVAHGTWAGGSETTQYLDTGEYEVARCDSTGRLVLLQEVETIDVQGEQIRIVQGQTEPAGAPNDPGLRFQRWAALYPDPAGSTPSYWESAAEGALPPTPTNLEVSPEITLMGHLPDRGCDSRRFRLNYRWDFNPRYRVHMPSLPHGSRTLRRIKDAHRVWNRTDDGCRRVDRTEFHMVYDGTSSGRADAGDGQDTVDFGPLGDGFCGQRAVACARSAGSIGSDSQLGISIIDEVDIRFNSSPTFSDGSQASWYSGIAHDVPTGKYDVFSVGAHEAGHKTGLGHVGSRFHQTLSPRLGTDSRRRDLGRGDVRGLYRLYRGRNLGSDPR